MERETSGIVWEKQRQMKETKGKKREMELTAIKWSSNVWRTWEKKTQTKWDVVDDDWEYGDVLYW